MDIEEARLIGREHRFWDAQGVTFPQAMNDRVQGLLRQFGIEDEFPPIKTPSVQPLPKLGGQMYKRNF